MTDVASHTPGPGIFITFEGGEGAGKTTHSNFLAKALVSHGYEVINLREPGGTPISESLRSVVLDADNATMSDRTELLIYEAARAQLVSEVIIPALARGAVVLCDRFYDSTIAYQAYGRGLPLEFVRTANNFACQGVHPARTLLMVSGGDAAYGIDRATHHSQADRLEQAGLEFHTRVNEAFLGIAKRCPERVRVIASDKPKSEVAHTVFSQVADIFGWDDVDQEFSPEFFESINWEHSQTKATTWQVE